MKRKDVRRRIPRPPRRKQGFTDTDIRKGILALMGALGVLAFCVLAGRLIQMMLIDHEYYEQKAIGNQTRSISVSADRGNIYDRNMDLLATSVGVHTIFLDPLELKQNDVDLELLADRLSELLELDREKVLRDAKDTSMRYKVLKRRQDQAVCDAVIAFVQEYDIVGVHLEPDTLRLYPNESAACQLLGFTNGENTGAEGLEAYYNGILEGTPGAIITAKGNHETEMLYSYEKYYEATDGNSLVLTIDLTVQRALEKQMKDAIDRYDVENGAFGMVMDVNTGEILAMATLGGYDPNSYLEIYDEDTAAALELLYAQAESLPEGSEERSRAFSLYNEGVAAARLKQWRNRCVSDGYEPGSTFKVLTLAAALDSGAVTLNDHFSCGGRERFEGRSQPVNCWKSQGHGGQTTAQALQNSCNLAFSHIGLRTGGETLYEYFSAFGLMETTGIDLPGEARGIFHTRERLADTEQNGTSYLIATSFGQTVKPTAIQLVRAIAAVVNGGYLMEPYVVSHILDNCGNIVEEHKPTVLRQVISEETSEIMCGLIESVVSEGTAKNAQVAGYRIGGKTGTAEKTDQTDASGAQTKDKIVSFVGIAPMDDPQYIVLIALDTPNPATGLYISGGVMAAPTVGAVLEDILPYLGVSPEGEAAATVLMPDLQGLTEAQAAAKLQENGLSYRIIGSGSKVLGQIPKAGNRLPGGATVLLYTDNSMPTDRPVVPSLLGMTLEEATRKLSDLGLYLQPKGADPTQWRVTAISQDLPPGTEVERGTTVTVTFADTTAMD